MARETFNVNGIDGLSAVLGDVFDSIAIQFQEVEYTEPLSDAIKTLEQQHEVMYANGQDSNGDAWAPLAPSTIAKKGHDTILVDKKKMRASLVSETGDSIRDIVSEGRIAGAVFGTDLEYAGFHVEGTARMPARPPVGISEETIETVTNKVADHTVAAISN